MYIEMLVEHNYKFQVCFQKLTASLLLLASFEAKNNKSFLNFSEEKSTGSSDNPKPQNSGHIKPLLILLLLDPQHGNGTMLFLEGTHSGLDTWNSREIGKEIAQVIQRDEVP